VRSELLLLPPAACPLPESTFSYAAGQTAAVFCQYNDSLPTRKIYPGPPSHFLKFRFYAFGAALEGTGSVLIRRRRVNPAQLICDCRSPNSDYFTAAAFRAEFRWTFETTRSISILGSQRNSFAILPTLPAALHIHTISPCCHH